MFGHAIADAGQLLELFAVQGEFFDRFRNAGDEFGGLLVAAVTADDGAVNFQQLRGFTQDARDITIFHCRSSG